MVGRRGGHTPEGASPSQAGALGGPVSPHSVPSLGVVRGWPWCYFLGVALIARPRITAHGGLLFRKFCTCLPARSSSRLAGDLGPGPCRLHVSESAPSGCLLPTL